MARTAHVDTFARDHLPPREQQPEFLFDLPELRFPDALNCATELLDRRVAQAAATGRACVAPGGPRWTYAELQRAAEPHRARAGRRPAASCPATGCCCAAPNKPMLVACWFAVIKAGGIAVATMPLLRAKELAQIIDKAQISHALCDAPLADELEARGGGAAAVAVVRLFDDARRRRARSARWRAKPRPFDNVDTAADDTCLLAFTSGTTGVPKATMHFHRDVMATCACFPPHVLRAARRRRLHRQPAARVHLRPRRPAAVPDAVGAPSVLLEKADAGRPARRRSSRIGATVLLHRADRLPRDGSAARERASRRDGALRKCVVGRRGAARGDARARGSEPTGIEIIDGIGATEMLHIFISADEAMRAPGRHRQAPCRATARASSTTTAGRAAGHGRPARREGPDRLPLPRRPAPGDT